MVPAYGVMIGLEGLSGRRLELMAPHLDSCIFPVLSFVIWNGTFITPGHVLFIGDVSGMKDEMRERIDDEA